MSSSFELFQIENVVNGISTLTQSVKLLLYKTNNSIFEKIDFENDDIYQEPLLFAYFNAKQNLPHLLDLILYGYTSLGLRPKNISVTSDEFGRIYLPNIGWLITHKKNEHYILNTNKDNLILTYNNDIVDFNLIKNCIIKNTAVELLEYPVLLLNQFYYDINGSNINVEIEDISKKHKKNLIKAWNLIKKYAPNHYNIIALVTRKCVIFNIDTYLRNSFATLSAQGIAFFNAYQEDYNEVFFVDDIAHQTGHVIFNAMICEIRKFLRIDRDETLQNIHEGNDIIEKRTIYVVFHALYTYYTTFICLDACLSANAFRGFKRHEALGRIAFYINKCGQDLKLIDDPILTNDNSVKIFTIDGLTIYNEIKNTFYLMLKKWKEEIKDFDLSNQTYNFSNSIFFETNPIK